MTRTTHPDTVATLSEAMRRIEMDAMAAHIADLERQVADLQAGNKDFYARWGAAEARAEAAERELAISREYSKMVERDWERLSRELARYREVLGRYRKSHDREEAYYGVQPPCDCDLCKPARALLASGPQPESGQPSNRCPNCADGVIPVGAAVQLCKHCNDRRIKWEHAATTKERQPSGRERTPLEELHDEARVAKAFRQQPSVPTNWEGVGSGSDPEFVRTGFAPSVPEATAAAERPQAEPLS